MTHSSRSATRERISALLKDIRNDSATSTAHTDNDDDDDNDNNMDTGNNSNVMRNPSSTNSNSGLVKSAVETGTTVNAHGTCRPHSRADWAKRVATYKLTTWFNKPPALSPLVCARYGWENSKEDTLCCVTCKEYLTCTFEDAMSSNLEQALVGRLSAQLSEKHRGTCPWRTNICAPEFAAPPILSAEHERHTIGMRYNTLVGRDGVPPLAPHRSEVAQQAISRLARVLGESSDHDSELVLALFGWSCDMPTNDTPANTNTTANTLAMSATKGKSKPRSVHVNKPLQCALCQRTVAFWNFDDIDVGEAFDSDQIKALLEKSSTPTHTTNSKLSSSTTTATATHTIAPSSNKAAVGAVHSNKWARQLAPAHKPTTSTTPTTTASVVDGGKTAESSHTREMKNRAVNLIRTDKGRRYKSMEAGRDGVMLDGFGRDAHH